MSKMSEKPKFIKEPSEEQIETDEHGLPVSHARKIIVETEDIRMLLKLGQLELVNEGIELVLKKTPDDSEILLRKELKPHGNSAKVILPKRWLKKHKHVFVIVD